MNGNSLATLRDQWQQNRRLRYAVLAAILIGGANGLLTLSDATARRMDRQASEMAELSTMETTGRQQIWTARGAAAHAHLQKLRESIPDASSTGVAQADLDNRLRELAAVTQLTEVQIKVETALDVPDHPELLQAVGRLDGMVPEWGHQAFVQELAAELPWLQVEKLDIAPGAPARVGVVVRAYYRRPPSQGAAAPNDRGAE